MNRKRCRDKRPCFGRRGEYCQCLIKTYDRDGDCPFCKPEREVTDGKVYPIDIHYPGKERKAKA